jgi:hypothetical protein
MSESQDTEELMGVYFDDIYYQLQAKGVPEERLPTVWHILSRIMDHHVNWDGLLNWVDQYAEMEHDPLLREELEAIENPAPPPQKPRYRPSWLKVVDKKDDTDE